MFSDLLLAVLLCPTVADGGAEPPPTFHETIEPLLQQHCQRCHREGGGAPFALIDYDEVKGWAPQIGEVVSTRRMPPWHADRSVGRFANDPSLDDATIARFAAWIAGGAKEGDRTKAPPPREWPQGWSLAPPPDLVLVAAPFAIPAEGVLPYRYVRLPTELAEDRWVRAAELKSTHAEVVHHALVFLDERRGRGVAHGPRPWRPGFNQMELMQGAKPREVAAISARLQEAIRRDLRYGEAGGLNGYFLSGLAGGGPVEYAAGEGKLLPAGGELLFQIHYQPSGTAVESTTSLALWFATETPPRPLDTRAVATVAFVIPPGAPDHEVAAEYRLPAAATLRSLQPHMHLRGKDVTYLVRHDDGREETLLRVPDYDFNWQHEYVLETPLELAEGDVLRVVAHFDNSAANPLNPDPEQTVWFGLQTNDEMLIGYYEVVWHP